MYKIILDEGVVLNQDGVQVAPCQSDEDPAFVVYNEWIAAGNQPIIPDTRG